MEQLACRVLGPNPGARDTGQDRHSLCPQETYLLMGKRIDTKTVSKMRQGKETGMMLGQERPRSDKVTRALTGDSKYKSPEGDLAGILRVAGEEQKAITSECPSGAPV